MLSFLLSNFFVVVKFTFRPLNYRFSFQVWNFFIYTRDSSKRFANDFPYATSVFMTYRTGALIHCIFQFTVYTSVHNLYNPKMPFANSKLPQYHFITEHRTLLKTISWLDTHGIDGTFLCKSKSFCTNSKIRVKTRVFIGAGICNIYIYNCTLYSFIHLSLSDALLQCPTAPL